MSKNRLELQKLLEESLGSRNVYFQPPATIQMKYPAIVYSLSDIDLTNANNSAYLLDRSYEIIVIDKNPDSIIPDKILQLPLCRFNRSYTADNLNHFVFTLVY